MFSENTKDLTEKNGNNSSLIAIWNFLIKNSCLTSETKETGHKPNFIEVESLRGQPQNKHNRRWGYWFIIQGTVKPIESCCHQSC